MTSTLPRMTPWTNKHHFGSRPGSTSERNRQGPIAFRSHPVKVLFWFSRVDSRSKALCRACTRLQLTYDAAYTTERALEVYSQNSPQLVIVDQRNSKHVPGVPALQLRSSKPGSYGMLVALVSKSYIAKEGAAATLLQKGFSRWIVESTNDVQCYNELQMLTQSDVDVHTRLQTTDTLFLALNEAREQIVEITDADYTVLYVNRTGVDALGFSRDEMYGHNLFKLHQLDITRPEQADQIVATLTKGRDYDGHFNCRRRNGNSLLLPCKAFPVCANGRTIDHHVFVKECPAFVLERPAPISRTRTRASVRSLRKPSFDLRTTSNGSHVVVRRASLAKVPAGIEAPITKVIDIISAAKQSAPMYVAQALDKGLEILRSSELYSPQLNIPGTKDQITAKMQDPVTNDLLGALLSQGPSPSAESTVSRRASEGAGRSHRSSRPSLPNIQTNSATIQTMLQRDMHWDFDIFQLERITGKRPLIWMGMDIFLKFDVPNTLNVDIATVENWLNLIEANYHSQNSYHNSTHACDVLHCTAYFLERERLKAVFDPVDEAICLIASAVHDVDHPGKNSQYMCNTRNELAHLYNDITVLESHHAAFAYKLTLSDHRVNIFKNLDDATYKRMRQSIIDMVLATEMSKHYEHLSKFLNVFNPPAVGSEEEVDLDMEKMCAPDNIVLIKRMLIKCADVSNPLRPKQMCIEWAQRIAEEYFAQTDSEKEKNLPVVMPIFDRATCSIPKSQKGFIEFFINNMFEAWDNLIEIPDLIDILEENYQYWCDLELEESRAEPAEDIAEESGQDSASSVGEEDLQRTESPTAGDANRSSNGGAPTAIAGSNTVGVSDITAGAETERSAVASPSSPVSPSPPLVQVHSAD